MQLITKVKSLAALAFSKLRNRNAAPARYNPCNFLISNILMNRNRILFYCLFLSFKSLNELWKSAVFKLSSLVKVVAALSLCNLILYIFNFSSNAMKLFKRPLFLLPFSSTGIQLFLGICKLFLQSVETLK